MFSIERLRAVLAVLVFLAALFFAGFTSENLKQVIPEVDRVILIVGFILGAHSVMQWIAKGSFGRLKRSDRRT
ncbi:MAG: hypothetical protein KAF27_03000 [Porphyrobacter sp.]|nr:hypothetical protein [Porphyrobacter sp.]